MRRALTATGDEMIYQPVIIGLRFNIIVQLIKFNGMVALLAWLCHLCKCLEIYHANIVAKNAFIHFA